MYYTTLRRIREMSPCSRGWGRLLAYLGKTQADDEPLPLSTILESNGIRDAIWALRAIDDCAEIRLYAVRCARQIQHLIRDQRIQDTLDIVEQFAIGNATKTELDAARDAAWAAARDAAWDAAARDAARAAALTAADAAARDAALTAARAAADAAALTAAWDAADAAAWGAAWAAAWDATWDAQQNDFIAIFCQPD